MKRALFPFSPAVDALIDLALTEDLGAGDLTSDHLFTPDQHAHAALLAKQRLVVAGLGVFERVLQRVDERLAFAPLVGDGRTVAEGELLARLDGPARSLLRAERTGLNFLNHLSGVATLTAEYAAAAGDRMVIADTRKTTPGFRELEKYAVRMGGGRNHRFNLGAAAMIKDNHIAAAGSIAKAVDILRRRLPHTATVEVETTTLDEVDEALDAGADIIMLDNMDDEMIREAVARCRGRAVTEASGNITLERLPALAATGVDVVSSGALTHSAKVADISLEVALDS